MRNFPPSGVQFVPPLQMLAPDGKIRKTQAANVEGISRIIRNK
jgi:hypothetical protein